MTGELNAAERVAAVARVQRARGLLTEDAEPYAAAALQVLLDRTVPELLECIDDLEGQLGRRRQLDVAHVSRARVRLEVLDELGQWAVQRWGSSIVVDEIELRRDAAAKELSEGDHDHVHEVDRLDEVDGRRRR